MIVLGILIALGLESALEYRHHRHLVAEAKENLAHEIADNKRVVDSVLASLKTQEGDLRNALRWAREMRTLGKTDIHEMRLGFQIPSLSTASWRTAEVTGALGHMTYAEVKSYSEIYGVQDLLARAEALKLERFSGALSPRPGRRPRKSLPR